MKLQSCQNCWFNGLQYGAVGLSVGFCVRHRKVLNLSDETTCGLHIRKDLGLERAEEVASLHKGAFDAERIVRLATKEEVEADFSGSDKDAALVSRDPVGEAVVDYGSLDSKIESLAQLKVLNTARSDLAMTSLGRAYVSNCVKRGGRWTSGIHLYWWTTRRLASIPDLQVGDMRYGGSIQLSRQFELTTWSLMMLRLSFIDDIVRYADREDDDIGRVGDVMNEAAGAVQGFSVAKLSRWIERTLVPALEARLSYRRYSALARELHRDAPTDSHAY